jgi:hypothetical protein
MAAVVFWGLLSFGMFAGGPIDPQDIEDTLRIMNEAKVEVVVEKRGPPNDLTGFVRDIPAAAGEPREATDTGKQSSRRNARLMARLRGWLKRM